MEGKQWKVSNNKGKHLLNNEDCCLVSFEL